MASRDRGLVWANAKATRSKGALPRVPAAFCRPMLSALSAADSASHVSEDAKTRLVSARSVVSAPYGVRRVRCHPCVVSDLSSQGLPRVKNDK